MELGDLSSLNEEIGEKQDFNQRDTQNEKWCLAYGRDRGESNIQSKLHGNEDAFLDATNGCCGEYAYLFEEGEWKVAILYGEKFAEWKTLDSYVH